ncbi:hypothetical protein RISK_006763 [Rhodopirellula islandica]|uniref:Uncharacterized protein n=1 Tax=Rhodopirellula islandica TaxID=595434 RepID=A0A0J1E6W0_RHOIS|nr:hypothetical protein RISK_006763 [Rhodopirellula islandica]
MGSLFHSEINDATTSPICGASELRTDLEQVLVLHRIIDGGPVLTSDSVSLAGQSNPLPAS